MNELNAKQLVIQAGLDLIKKGLIARTWGNVSCRVDSESFAITPSGRPYESLIPEEIVICKIADASYTGDVKPSSERGVHALIYRERPEANFVIHTHQTQASAVSVLDKEEIPAELSSQGAAIRLARYGLPSTKKLSKGIEAALSESKGKAVIMAHHGVVCYGSDSSDAFETALALEKDSQTFIKKVYSDASGEKLINESDIYSYYCYRQAAAFINAKTPQNLGCSRRTSNGFVLEKNGNETEYRMSQKFLFDEAGIHAEIYRRRKDVSFITHADREPLLAAATAKTPLVPMLDDFAQLVGRHAFCSKSASPSDVAGALGKRAGVLVPEHGALCCAGTQSDVKAVQIVMEKNAYAQICAELTGNPRALSLADCLIMRTVYTLSYSKKSTKQTD